MTISITRQQRVVVLLTSVALALVLLFVSSVSAADSTDVDASEWTVTHLVVGGDTLWEIALDVTPPGDDVRIVVEDIKRHNGLTSSLIMPGQVLLVPVGG
ncbi:MAG TPA: LysM peptidoglycan-binding domain-containing protein [Acidimicrobiia bacterium]|nr:LysM peptidoglycan-binding domain-containing protein [Acidimicrobiia bacterium]